MNERITEEHCPCEHGSPWTINTFEVDGQKYVGRTFYVRTADGEIGYVDEFDGTRVTSATVLTATGGYHLEGDDLDAITVHESEQEARDAWAIMSDAECRRAMVIDQPGLLLCDGRWLADDPSSGRVRHSVPRAAARLTFQRDPWSRSRGGWSDTNDRGIGQRAPARKASPRCLQRWRSRMVNKESRQRRFRSL